MVHVLLKPGLKNFEHYFSSMCCCCRQVAQSCPTLCNPRDGSLPGSAVPGILQARILEWVAIPFSNAWKWKVKVKSLSRSRLSATSWTAAYQVPPSMGFSRQEYWSGVPLPSPSLILHASKVMLKILQARFQQYVSHELPDVQASFRKGRGTRDQIAKIHQIIEKAREFQKNIYFCFIDYSKAFDCVDHNKLWKFLKEMGISDQLRNLPPEKPVCRTRSNS